MTRDELLEKLNEIQKSKYAIVLLCFEHRYKSSGYDELRLLFSAHEGFS